MPKYINAEKFLSDNAEFADRDFVHPKYNDTLRDLIDRAPAADVVERTYGYWIEYLNDGQMAQQCSECGRDPGVIYDYPNCPFCTAKMISKR